MTCVLAYGELRELSWASGLLYSIEQSAADALCYFEDENL